MADETFGERMDRLEALVASLPWWAFIWKRALRQRIARLRQLMDEARDAFIFDTIQGCR